MKSSPIPVREFGTLTTAKVDQSLDCATVPQSAFNWLCSSGAELVQMTDRQSLRLDNYVGVLETPCGTQIEILPKHVDAIDEIPKARRLLRKMLIVCMGLEGRESADADIDSFDGPLTEWINDRFLRHLQKLVKRGLRFDYQRIDDEQRFLRGCLDVGGQLRQPPGRQHLFRIAHDVYEPDRPENRLLRTALERVRLATRLEKNWRLASELASYLSPIPLSPNVPRDLEAWRNDRLMAHYQAVKPWCSLILNRQLPMSVAGSWRGPSLLFPMEQLYELYVVHCLRRSLKPGALLRHTVRFKCLCDHMDAPWFELQPDMYVQEGEARWVLDAKWKRLNAADNNPSAKYGLHGDDFYQMFAYGHQYLDGAGDLFLVYPKTSSFHTPLKPFQFSAAMRLWVVPFDLDAGRLAGEVECLPLR